jgi:hypothetical protein
VRLFQIRRATIFARILNAMPYILVNGYRHGTCNLLSLYLLYPLYLPLDQPTEEVKAIAIALQLPYTSRGTIIPPQLLS